MLGCVVVHIGLCGGCVVVHVGLCGGCVVVHVGLCGGCVVVHVGLCGGFPHPRHQCVCLTSTLSAQGHKTAG